jgi:hypothetical protein
MIAKQERKAMTMLARRLKKSKKSTIPEANAIINSKRFYLLSIQKFLIVSYSNLRLNLLGINVPLAINIVCYCTNCGNLSLPSNFPVDRG